MVKKIYKLKGTLMLLSAVLLVITAKAQTTVTLGSGTGVTGTTTASPVNNYYKSSRLQIVYTADEFYSSGWTAGTPGTISQIGFYVSQSPTYALPNWTIKMKQTSVKDAATYDGSGLTTVYTTASYIPASGGFQLVTLNTNFDWDGISNLLIDVCWDLSANFSSTGQVRAYGSASNLTSYVRSDATAECGASTSSFQSFKTQIRYVITANSNVPANDAICNATSLTIGAASKIGTNTNATTVAGDPTGSCWVGSSKSHTTWYSFTAPSSGQVVIKASATGFYTLTDNQIALFSSSDNTCNGTLTQVGCDDNTGTTGCSNCANLTASGLTSGNTYFIELDGYSTTSGAFTITVESNAIDWVGGTSTSWITATNWSSGVVPTSTTNVHIPSGTSNSATVPTNTTAYCRNLTVDASATLTIETGCIPPPGSCTYTNFYIYGDVVNNGSIVHNGNLYMQLKGDNVSISGTGSYSTSSGVGPGFSFGAGNTYNLSSNLSAFKYIKIDGTLNIGSNTLSTTNFTLSDGGICNQNTGTIEIAQTTVPTFTGTFNAGTGTTYYNSTTTLIVSETPTYYNLKVRENNTYTAHLANAGVLLTTNLELVNPGVAGGTAHLHGALDIAGSVTIGSGCTFAPGYNINLEGNFNSSGTYTASTYTVAFDGTSAQTIGGSTATSFNNLTINNSNGLTLNTAATITGALTFTNGKFNTDATNILTLETASTTSGGGTGKFIDGPVNKKTNTTSFFQIPTGDGSRWMPVGITPSSTSAHTWKAESYSTGYSNQTVDATLTRVSAGQYWQLDRTVGTGNCKIRVYWDSSSSVDDTTQIKVAHWTGSAWQNAGDYVSGGTTSSGWVETPAWGTFSPFTLGSSGSNNPLPIELLSFSAEVDNNVVKVNWITASEINNDYFNIEKSNDAVIFQTFSTIDGAGNSTREIHYSTIDENPSRGISYYRLVQTDFDGKYTYSPVVAITFKPEKFEIVDILPNPTDYTTTISFNSTGNDQVTLKVYNSGGQEIWKKYIVSSSGVNEVVIDASGFSKGIYYICLENQVNQLLQSKLIKCTGLKN